MTETFQLKTYNGNTPNGSGTLTLTIDGTTASGTITLEGMVTDAELTGTNQDIAKGEMGFAHFVDANYSSSDTVLQVLALVRPAVKGTFGGGPDTVAGLLSYAVVGGAVPGYISFTGVAVKS